MHLENEISLYKGTLSTPCVIQNVAKIKNAFPSLHEGFYEVLSERLVEIGFNDSRLSDAVNHVIDNCVYPTPTIAQFISFDKKVKVFKYPDIIEMVDAGDLRAFDRYGRIKLPEFPEAVYIHVNDIAKFNIKSE
jgi:hypothetical protein